MPNVLLTTKCNLNCAYCFAQERLQNSPSRVMSMSDVVKVIDFLKRSNQPIFRAMGGEPTLHPQFASIIEMAFREGMSVDVLSNATWPDTYNTLFNSISPRFLSFLINVDHPDNYSPKVWDKIAHNLAAVAPRGNVTLSFNIFETQPKYEYILELTRKHGIDKVRMSFSLPVLGGRNVHLNLEDYKTVAPFIVDFNRRAEDLGVEVRMDNAVPLCIFSYEEVGELLLKGVLDLRRNSRCDPIVDIGPDLTVWCCFCLSKLWNRHLDEFQNLEEIQDYYRQAMSAYQCRLYPMDECSECKYRELWACQGGCLTYTIMKHGELTPEETPLQQKRSDWQSGTVLTFSPDVEIQHYDIPKSSYSVLNKVSGLVMEVDSSFEPLIRMLKGQYTAQQVVDRFVDDGRDPQVKGPVAEFSQRTMKQGANDLLRGLLHQGFLVER
jgi:radical SAM protein with 4Fe4S-binding SPASM domain